MERSRDVNWLALVRCYCEVCREEGVTPDTEEADLLAFAHDTEWLADNEVEQETWLQ